MNITNIGRISGCRSLLTTIAATLTLAGTVATLGAQVPATKASVATQKGLDITLRTQPSPPKTGNTRLEVTVNGADGKPVTEADVTVDFHMAAMPKMKMPEMKNQVKLKAASAPGTYEGTANITMAGTWDVTVHVMQKGKEIGSKKQTLIAQ